MRCAPLFGLSVFLLSACGSETVWVKDHATPVEEKKAVGICRKQAFDKFPPFIQELSKTRGSCDTDKKGRQSCSSYTSIDKYDSNKAARDQQYKYCMKEAGWTLVELQEGTYLYGRLVHDDKIGSLKVEDQTFE